MAVTLISDTTKTFFTSSSMAYEKLKNDKEALVRYALNSVIKHGTQKQMGPKIIKMCQQYDVRVYATKETRAQDIASLVKKGYSKLTTR
ncbi:TPA: hypothetical protein RQK43_004446 [Vibrio vulnificus]|uniref:hypothetical protein n=1 Tax=Vibrio vulnificus TaxID=672 RepID=UPI001A255B6A|nr:hypothetical protein [Vibrio vulnificus]MCU8317904.1 hypothetical protein [Vibrio vulnificus]HAS6222209.1 hypothetical protein [Vibrio vulnificus]HAT8530711.1 hypothetical protein [Vibrio vulnificus]HDY7864642.1 hypothetical protein [Vibrio vulnificus]